MRSIEHGGSNMPAHDSATLTASPWNAFRALLTARRIPQPRFRTRISDPRDVAFVFASMAVGIACGVHSFLNGIIGTLAFCLVVVIIRFSPFGQKSNMLGSLRVESIIEKGGAGPLADVLEKYCKPFSLKRMRFSTSAEGKDNYEYEYRFKLKPGMTLTALIADIRSQENILLSRINFDDENDVDTL